MWQAWLAEAIMPELWPALCVVQDENYEKAMELIRSSVTEDAENSEFEVTCSACGESNPGNFDLCWSCGESIKMPAAEK